MADKFLLKDHLFNPETVGQLAAEFAAGVPSFDAARFQSEALAGFPSRELMDRLDWLATCVEAQLSPDFPVMADQLEAAMPARLDPALADDDFGHFIHGVPGILAVRHGLDDHVERALDLLHSATQRFSMEFYIRPFLNRWPDKTLARLSIWAGDKNYHVRRLVSEGTRPKLPWAKAVTLTQDQTLPLLDHLFADQTRYVTRSVANHLNDIAKFAPDLVVQQLDTWGKRAKQADKEMAWMQRHALRTSVKDGHAGALKMLGYAADAPVRVSAQITTPDVAIGSILAFDVQIAADQDCDVLVDYRIRFARPSGKPAEKVFKLKQGKVRLDAPLVLAKKHRLKAEASTFRWHAGTHALIVQVNGVDHIELPFDVTV
jgi:3-methyladenine DNA glycosylase AlkC